MDLWLEPDIWIPPLIGPYLIERRVRRELQEALRALEAAAAGGGGDD